MSTSTSKVKALRRANGWSQQQLAQAAGLSVKTVQRLERDAACSLETLAAIASVFAVSIHQIVPQAADESESASATSARILGLYGPLLAAISDALKETHHWRQHFNDLFMFRKFFMRKPDPPLFEGVERQARLASTVSLQLHEDVAEGVRQLKHLDYEVQSVGGHIRSLSGIGYHVSPEVQQEGTIIGNATCDNIEFYLGRARKELIARVFTEQAS
jgi:transcriptional regulator with XRE-family HTH domain